MQYWSLVHDADLFVDLSNLFREGRWYIGGTGGNCPPPPSFLSSCFSVDIREELERNGRLWSKMVPNKV